MPGLVIDNFAGGGGASTGIEAALGRPVDYAINHDAKALAMHERNHPLTRHIKEDVFKVWPRAIVQDRAVELAWFSPDCTHHSKAKGGKPLSRKRRGLAGVAVKWADQVQPTVMIVENVEEFEDWGPLLRATGRPNPEKKGQHFRRWVNSLCELGYDVEWQQLVAADYGVPTTRKRLFIIARNDGLPIVWPRPTHRSPKAKPDLFNFDCEMWRGAHECIDFSLPTPSIFLSKEEARRRFRVKRPLADNTCRRLARGIVKYVLACANPFIVRVAHGEGAGATRRRGHGEHGLELPLPTATTSNEFALVQPFLTEHANASSPRSMPVTEPMRTQCANVKGGHFALAAPFLAPRYGEGPGQQPRSVAVTGPMPTVVPTANGGSLAVAHLSPFYSHGGNGEIRKPADTVLAQGNHAALAMAFLAKHYGGVTGHGVERPLGAVTGIDHHSLITAQVASAEQEEGALRVAAFLMTYYGEGLGQALGRPCRTVTTKDRLALVTVVIGGVPLLVWDIGLRMLQPFELAAAMSFPEGYGLPSSKSDAVQFIGNAVCPRMAEVLVRANAPSLMERRAYA